MRSSPSRADGSPAPAPSLRLGAESLGVAAGSTCLALLLLGAGSEWRRGLVGNWDAWQTFWNLHHVDRSLRAGTSLLRTDQLWAPDGAGLWSHTLSLTNSIPGALLARLVGFHLSCNLLIVASFVLAAVACYRLSRRFGIGPAGAVFGAAVYAFAPPHFVRSWSHLNLLGTGWIPLALEGLLVASRGATPKARRLGMLLGATALVGLVFTDWYLGLLGAVAASSFAIFEVVRAEEGSRGRTALRLGAVAAIALAIAAPAGLALWREMGGSGSRGHDPSTLSASVTSLVIPSRAQRVASLLGRWPDASGQPALEGTAYLGFVPLGLTIWVLAGKARRGEFDFAATAGIVGLVLALGPALKVLDRTLAVPLPYAAVERWIPALRLGGSVNRFNLLVLLPLGLGAAAGIDRLVRSGNRGVAFASFLTAATAVEYAPAPVPFAVWPGDQAMTFVRNAEQKGNVLDVDPGIAALVRQVDHGRPQLFGYLARTPLRQWEERARDPILGPMLDGSRPSRVLPRPVVAAFLRDVWGAAFVVSPDVAPYRERGAALGFDLVATQPLLSLVWRVPDESPTALSHAELGDGEESLLANGVLLRGFFGVERLEIGAAPVAGRWTSPEASLLVPVRPGRWSLVASAPRPGPTRLVVTWGRNNRRIERVIDGVIHVPFDVDLIDCFPDGMLTIRLSTNPFVAPDGRPLGVFVSALEPRG